MVVSLVITVSYKTSKWIYPRKPPQSYIERFRAKATKAKQAQSRIKALQRMQQIAPAHVDSPFHFSLREPEVSPMTRPWKRPRASSARLSVPRIRI